MEIITKVDKNGRAYKLCVLTCQKCGEIVYKRTNYDRERGIFCIHCVHSLRPHKIDKIVDEKECATCKQILPIKSFYRGNGGWNYNSSCAQCNKLRKYGLNYKTHLNMLSKQDYRCAICKRSEQTKKNSSVQHLSVDHCHTTGKTRGLLCHRCNAALGLLKEDSETLKEMIKYLNKHNKIIQ